MRHINSLGFAFLTPALIIVVLFFLAPVVLTIFFAFSNMSTSTGITGGDYLLNETNLRDLSETGVSQPTIDALNSAGYKVDAAGLGRLALARDQATADEFDALHGGAEFSNRRGIEPTFPK